MQAINHAVHRSGRSVLLLGLGPGLACLALAAAVPASGPAPGWLAAAALVSLAGVAGVGGAVNVALDRGLDRLQATGAAAASDWRGVYRPVWTGWTHPRAAACLRTALCLGAGAAIG